MTDVKVNRFEVSSNIFNKWLSIKQKGGSLEGFFYDNDVSSIAIYGVGALGERLLDELEDSGVRVVYGIDRANGQKKNLRIEIYGVEMLPDFDIDAIVVTPVHDYWSIVENLEKYVDCPILSLEDIVNYCYF